MDRKKPVIGLTSSFMIHEDTEKIFLPHSYFEAIRHFGGIPLLIPVLASDDELQFLLDRCDGLLLTGGDDIDPGLFGEEKLNDTVVIAPERDAQEGRVIDMALERNLPIFGICRGIQMLNVFQGGTLHQHIDGHSDFKSRSTGCHKVSILPGSRLETILSESCLTVNSLHHQAVDALGKDLAVCAVSEDGIVEAVIHTSHPFCLAFQWHPEHMSRKNKGQQKIFDTFVNACKK
jgi:putative glutamine amidotransferase